MVRFFKYSALLILFFVLVGLNAVCIWAYFRNLEPKKVISELYTPVELTYSYSDSHATLAGSPFILGAMDSEVTLKDARIQNLERFFKKYGSPLLEHAEGMVKVSDKYQFDYRLLAAIAMQESGLCKYEPEGSHNCWGYGIYGTNVIRFVSYEEAMERVAKTLRTQYIDKGLVTPSAIMAKYTPRSDGSWAESIQYFFEKLEE